MKVRNLLLAGLAVAAMTACSNDIDEMADNNTPLTGEDANMRLYFNFAEQGTRAAGDPTGNEEKGEEIEWTVKGSTITVVLKYANSNKSVVIQNLKPIAEGDRYTTDAFQVMAGNNVTVYAFVNPNNLTINDNLDPENIVLDNPVKLPASGLDYLAEGVAKGNAFMMSGKATNVNIKGGADETVNKATISVDRVSAKLDEGTKVGKIFTINPEKTIYKNINDKNVNIVLEAFSYSNLTDNTYALNGARTNSYDKVSYLQPYFGEGFYPTDKKTDYRWINKADKNIIYCLENYGNNNPTKVHYKGKVYIGDEEITTDFYIRAVLNTTSGKTEYFFFKDLAAMKTFYNDEEINKITDTTSREDLSYLGIKKYTGGTCYYEADINTTVETADGTAKKVSIMRNNWYKLTVNSISEIGTPTPAPDPEDKTTKLIVETTINKWKVQVNDFNL